jgi:acetyl-CoA C-acetyltransferase
MTTSYLIDAVRTPRGRGKPGKGALSGVHPQELIAFVLRELERRESVTPRDVEDVILGTVSQIGEQGGNLARNAVLSARWPVHVPGVSLNRLCASGLQSVHFASQAVASGQQDLVVAGGVESMSRVPMASDGGGLDGHNAQLREHLVQIPQGVSADLIASRYGYSRRDVDAWALRSQQRASQAIEQGRFSRSLVALRDARGHVLLERDELPRPDTSAEGLASLKPSFASLGATVASASGLTLDQIALATYPDVKTIDHVHTAGNSSGIVDGAAAVVVASERYVREHGIRPRARIRANAVIGSEPVMMLTAPAPVSQRVLQKAGMKASDIDLWEINEAFAAVVLQTIDALALDPDRVNVNGGAIALGHPLGATGAMLLGTALDELERSGKQTALIAMCVGGGQGIATILERV